MRHRVKKIRFQAGRDATKSITKKLVYNFFLRGKVETTLKRTKVLKSRIEKIVDKIKGRSQADKNYLLRFFGNDQFVTKLFKDKEADFKEKKGVAVKLIKLGARESDGAQMAKVEWIYQGKREATVPPKNK